MASSSSSAHALKYDVFLSFRGEDTRNTFTSHLHSALVQKRIETYIDYALVRGERIAPALLEAIEESRISVVILSQHYASSTWCLDELAHILECKERLGQIVIPVFYGIDPSRVRHQRGSYAAAFLDHEERFEDKPDKLLMWRDALTEASKLSGFDSRNFGPESELVDVVVKDIVMKLSRECSSDLKGIIGIERRIQKIESLLCIKPDDVRVRTVGIWGLGGIGKTTLAGAVFNRISSQFDASHFLADVRERSDKHGLVHLRNELFCNLLKDESLRIGTPSIGSTYIKRRLSSAKVLVVVDDVNHVRQLEVLVGDQVQFGPGSRIIITTRDMQQLREMQQLQKGAEHDVMIYEAEELDHDESLQLFYLNDSEEVSYKVDYSEIIRRVVHHAAGIPLALKIWGSLYRRCRSTQERERFLEKLKRFPEKELQDVYKISYDALGENEKEIFLYIACFHKGHGKSSAIEQLNACGLFADSGIQALVDMSLISIKNGWRTGAEEKIHYLWMHDVIQEMGWAIEREQHPAKPGKRSRLCTLEDICYVLENSEGTEKVQSISLNLSMITKQQKLNPQAFKKMSNLKLLQFYGGDGMGCCHYPWKDWLQDLEYLPDSLVYLRWPEYTLKYLPSTFSAMNLTELFMTGSQLQRLWNDGQKPRNLKHIDLSDSKLVEVPDLSMSLNIERINLAGCRGLVEVPSYFENLHKLTWLNLSGCLNLGVLSDMPSSLVSLQLCETAVEDLPSSIWSLENLKKLNLDGCKRINRLPNSIRKLYSLRSLVLSGTNIEELPSSIGGLSKLKRLKLQNCKRFTSLPTSICKLKWLWELLLDGCSSFKNFPEILEPMERLGNLGLGRTKVTELPCLIGNVAGHKELVVPAEHRCFASVPNSILPPASINLWPSMFWVTLSGCKMLEEIPDCIFSQNSLDTLDVSGTLIRSIPSTINQASNLRELYVNNCKRLESLQELPHVLYIYADGCTRLKTVSWSTRTTPLWLGTMVHLIFYNCPSLDENARSNIMEAVQVYPTDDKVKGRAICSGNEIPKWVTNQMEGSTIHITLPPHWSEDANFLGLAFYAVVDFDHKPDQSLKFAPRFQLQTDGFFKTENDTRPFLFSAAFSSSSRTVCDEDKSDHLMAWYDSLRQVRSTHSTNATEAHFIFSGRRRDGGYDYPVKRCGVGFVYAQGQDRTGGKLQLSHR